MVAGSLWEHGETGLPSRPLNWYPVPATGTRKESVFGLFKHNVPAAPTDLNAIPVTVMRCVRCGLLAAYALAPTPPPSPSETDR